MHAAFVGDMWDKLGALGEQVDPLLFSNQEAPGFAHPGASVLAELQRGADLGAKMFHCFADLHSAGRKRSLILGTDSPTLPAEIIEEAVDALGANDAVLTPVEDGGYCLIGVREPHPEMFAGVSWSTANTLGETEAALRHCGWSVYLTRGWYDVDTPRDLVRLSRDERTPPRTRVWLAEHAELVDGIVSGQARAELADETGIGATRCHESERRSSS